MRRLLIALFVGAFLLVPLCSLAQEAPKPGPEAQRLASLVGAWQDETTMPKTPYGPGGKETGTSTCEWFTGNFQVVCRGESTGTAGKTVGMMVVGWSPGRKAYLLQVMDSRGVIQQMTGTVTGNTWTFTNDGPIPPGMPGTSAKARMTIIDVSPTIQTSKLDVSVDGGPWTVVMEGKSTKVK